jgi:hypothetical protein
LAVLGDLCGKYMQLQRLKRNYILTALPAPASGFANNRLTQERQGKIFLFSEERPANKKLDACGNYCFIFPKGMYRIIFRGQRNVMPSLSSSWRSLALSAVKS